MKRILLASASALMAAGLIGSASAADLPRRAVTPAPAVVAPFYNWTGFYVGINGGGAFGSSDWSPSAPADFDVSGGLAGGTIGYNWQFGTWVLGLEGDIDWADISGTTTSVLCPAGCETKNTWLGTVRGRAGYAFDRWMPYVTGGAAFGEIEGNAPGFPGGSSTEAGWTVGAGVEFALFSKLTAKVEYLYVDLGSFNCGAACNGFNPENVSFTTNIVRGGLNYRF